MIFKRFIVGLFLALNTLAAQSLYEVYQTQGITALEAHMDQTLATKEHWLEVLKPYKDLRYGWYNSFDTLLLSNKKERRLVKLGKKVDHSFSVEQNLSSFVGKIDGDKNIEGDLKTPIGAYLLKRQLTNVDPFYGPLALVTNYPNSYDRALKKTGSGIWIHGLPFTGDRDDFTKGCIAIENSDITTLANNLNVKHTILLSAKEKVPTTNAQEIATILKELFRWRNAWKVNDFNTYISYYHSSFRRYDAMALAPFARYKEDLFSRTSLHKEINLYDINVAVYPNMHNQKLFYISMTEKYNTAHVHYHGRKQLFVLLENSRMYIVSEN